MVCPNSYLFCNFKKRLITLFLCQHKVTTFLCISSARPPPHTTCYQSETSISMLSFSTGQQHPFLPFWLLFCQLLFSDLCPSSASATTLLLLSLTFLPLAFWSPFLTVTFCFLWFPLHCWMDHRRKDYWLLLRWTVCIWEPPIYF